MAKKIRVIQEKVVEVTSCLKCPHGRVWQSRDDWGYSDDFTIDCAHPTITRRHVGHADTREGLAKLRIPGFCPLNDGDVVRREVPNA